MSFGLLLQCASAATDLDRIRSYVAGGINWPSLIDATVRHGIAPLVHERVREACPDQVPSWALNELRLLSHASAQCSLAYTVELIRVLNAFEAAGINPIVFKGPVAAWTLYKTPGLRPMGDLDLLVRTPDVIEAVRIVKQLGYIPEKHCSDPALYRFGRQIRLVNGSGQCLEIHWSLGPWYFASWFPEEVIWSRPATVQIAGRPVLTLGGEDMLRFMCMHSAKHGWNSLRDVADLTRLIASKPDLAPALCDAARYGGLRTVSLGLALAHELGNTPLPSDSRRLWYIANPRATGDAKYRLGSTAPEMGSIDAFRWHWRFLDRATDRVRLCFGQLLPNVVDWQAMPLPERLTSVYFLLKPIRLAIRYLVRTNAPGAT